MRPAAFAAGLMLDQQEREQQQQLLKLLVANSDFYRQLDHGQLRLIQRWRARQLV
jgi:hypothetical protein